MHLQVATSRRSYTLASCNNIYIIKETVPTGMMHELDKMLHFLIMPHFKL
jgi:hypothetical protein